MMSRQLRFWTQHWGAMMRKLALPDVVYLRTSPTLPVAEAYDALQISRGRAYQLRQHNNFPPAPGRVIDTARLANWLKTRGNCRVVWV